MPTLRAAVARLFAAGIPGPILDDDTRRLHADTPFGGVVLFRRNAGAPPALRTLVRAIHALDPAVPPLVAIDHEGGKVHRLAPPFTHFPAAAIVAAHGAAAVHDVAAAMARELAAIEIDLTFAPVLDVASNPANPVIGERAFSADPDAVARCGLAVFRATRAAGLLACGKHFPGHGDTAADSHVELPVVEKSIRALVALELVPFRRAIAAHIPMLMTAHVRCPALDREQPATLSRPILTGWLRRRLGFRGVICSDDLEMGAITNHESPADAAVRALAAGADLLLVCQRQDRLRAAVDAVVRAVEAGELPERRIVEAYRRVLALRRWRRRHARAERLSVVGCRAHAQLNAGLQASPRT